MKVLMFGWEFPPHITGGLGTASYGLTKGLANHNVNVTFVIPKFAALYANSKVELPFPTQVLIFINKAIRSYWFLIIAGVIGKGGKNIEQIERRLGIHIDVREKEQEQARVKAIQKETVKREKKPNLLLLAIQK